MRNGGEHYERLGVCPLCGSPSIRIRRRRHRHLLWRCRSCNKAFSTPNVAEYTIPAGDDDKGYVFAESIPQMERRGSQHGRRDRRYVRRRSFPRIAAAAVVLIMILGAVGYFIFMAGAGNERGGPVQRPGSDDSTVAFDLQSPTPESVPTSADTPTPRPPTTAKTAQSDVATAIPTDTPVATPTVYSSPTPESTGADIPTPSPSATAKTDPTSATTAIPTDTPVATPTDLPRDTPTPTPIPTAMPQVSPTPKATTPSTAVLATFENGRWLIQNRPTLAASIIAIVWIRDGIAASESEAVQEVVTLAAFHEELTASLVDLPWFADGLTETELEGIKYLGYIAYDSEATATQLGAIPWFMDGITETEVGAIDNLAYIAQNSEAVAELTVDTSWFADGITETELEGIKYLGYIAYDSESAARLVADMFWFTDGITETEVGAIDTLAYIAQSSGTIAEFVAGKSWFTDGITETELEAVRYLGYIAYDNAAAAERIARMPFLAVIEPVDVSALDALSGLAGDSEELLQQILAHPSLVPGVTDALTPIVSMLYGVAKTNTTLIDRLLGPGNVDMERRSITLPLTGEVDLVIVRTSPGAVRSMDLLEHSVRASEELMGRPFPTRYVGLLYEEAVRGAYAGTNFGTHIAILPKYDVDDGSHEAESALGNIAHEVAHYYWSGNADWIDEGVAEFMTYTIESKRRGEPIEVATAPCAYARSIIELESLAPDADADYGAFGCNYSLGVRLFVDMYRVMGGDANWQGFNELYGKSQVEDDAADDRKGTALDIKHIREVFRSAPSSSVAIGRWYDGTEDYDLSQLDPRPADSALPTISGHIDEAYINIGEDGPRVSSFSVGDADGKTVWLNLGWSYNVTGGPHKLILDLFEFYEDGFEFRRDTVEITAEGQNVGGGSSVSVGSDEWATGRYWVYIYDGDRKVAEVQYEVTP